MNFHQITQSNFVLFDINGIKFCFGAQWHIQLDKHFNGQNISHYLSHGQASLLQNMLIAIFAKTRLSIAQQIILKFHTIFGYHPITRRQLVIMNLNSK